MTGSMAAILSSHEPRNVWVVVVKCRNTSGTRYPCSHQPVQARCEIFPSRYNSEHITGLRLHRHCSGDDISTCNCLNKFICEVDQIKFNCCTTQFLVFHLQNIRRNDKYCELLLVCGPLDNGGIRIILIISYLLQYGHSLVGKFPGQAMAIISSS